MATKNRSKDFWIIPKRVSLHQTICLIDGIIERKYDGTSWNEQKQNNLGVNLKNWGATQNGKNISNQSIRTLIASIPQYLGFLYINTTTTPSSICLTKAGYDLLKYHKNNLKKIPNLSNDMNDMITNSPIVLTQMEKLQLTNPIYLKDCENIFVFPFRMTLKLLLELDYLDREEIAYFLFNIKDESQFELKVKEIAQFRSISENFRTELIDSFKKTHIGNISLVQAPSSAYYESLCTASGIIDKIKISPNNVKKKINAIKIKENCKDYVKEILFKKYKDISIYDFKDKLNLWIEYIGNPDRCFPPVDIKICNKLNNSFLYKILQNGEEIHIDLINGMEKINFPMFIDEPYEIIIIDIENGNQMSSDVFIPTFDKKEYNVSVKNTINIKNITIESIASDILSHSDSTNFSGKFFNYLTVLKKIDNIDRINDKYLRGAYYEYLFFQYLSKLKDINLIDDVIWNGKISKYGLPTSAPGGKTGTPDIIFIVDNVHYILELTTIKSKSGQEKAELSSVTDHIRLYTNNHYTKKVGIFVAPVIHQRNTEVMKTILSQHNIYFISLTDSDFLNIMLNKNKSQIINCLEGLMR